MPATLLFMNFAIPADFKGITPARMGTLYCSTRLTNFSNAFGSIDGLSLEEHRAGGDLFLHFENLQFIGGFSIRAWIDHCSTKEIRLAFEFVTVHILARVQAFNNGEQLD